MLPPAIRKYQGRNVFAPRHKRILNGLSLTIEWPGTIDHFQLDQQVKCTAETVVYLYARYTPTRVAYQKGSRPLLEAIAKGVTKGIRDAAEKALALNRWIYTRLTLPGVTGAPAGLTEEEMISGYYSPCCNLCSRVFCMLTQTVGIPSRMVFLYSSFMNKSGQCEHTVAEAFVNGKWALFDPRLGRCYRHDDQRIADAWEIHLNPELLARALTEPERKAARKNGGALDARLFTEIALCNYFISDRRPARRRATKMKTSPTQLFQTQPPYFALRSS